MAETWENKALANAAYHGMYRMPVTGRHTWAALLPPPEVSLPYLKVLIDALTAIDCIYLREHPDTPLLFASDCFFEPEPLGQEQWLPIPFCLMRAEHGQGIDCEDIAAWYAAERRVRYDEHAQCMPELKDIVNRDGELVQQYHIVVRRGIILPDMSLPIVDPSSIMRLPKQSRKQYIEPQWRGNPKAHGRFFNAFLKRRG